MQRPSEHDKRFLFSPVIRKIQIKRIRVYVFHQIGNRLRLEGCREKEALTQKTNLQLPKGKCRRGIN